MERFRLARPELRHLAAWALHLRCDADGRDIATDAARAADKTADGQAPRHGPSVSSAILMVFIAQNLEELCAGMNSVIRMWVGRVSKISRHPLSLEMTNFLADLMEEMTERATVKEPGKGPMRIWVSHSRKLQMTNKPGLDGAFEAVFERHIGPLNRALDSSVGVAPLPPKV